MPISDENTRRRLFILPGLDGSGFGLQPFCDALKNDFDVTVLRLPNAESDYQRLTEWAIAEIGSTHAFYLLGESFSGPLAIKVAARCGARVSGLILCATFAHSPVRASAWLRRAVSAMPPLMPPVNVLAALLFGADANDRWRSEFAATIRTLDARVAKARVLQALSVDVREMALATLTKVLVLQASRDRLIQKHALAEFAVAQHDVVTEIIDGAHFLLQTRADECASAVRSRFHNSR